jgi:hypothetical protein
VTLTPTFKLVFLGLLALTVLSLLVACPIALLLSQQVHRENVQLKLIFDTCITTFKLGFGAILGLMGGKAL